jgi:glutathione S-transferase
VARAAGARTQGLAYNSHLLQLAMQEHKAPHMLALNPRGRVPVLKDGDYVVFESLAVLYYLERKYPARPLFGDSPEEGAVIMRVCCEYQAYIEPYLTRITRRCSIAREIPIPMRAPMRCT